MASTALTIPAEIWRWTRHVNELVGATGAKTRGRPFAQPLVQLGTLELSLVFSGATAESVLKRGVCSAVVAELALEGAISVEHVAEYIGLSPRALTRRVARGATLPPMAAEKAMLLIELMALALDVFRTIEHAFGWLTARHPMLDGKTPLQYARTPWGLDRVRALLGSLKWGFAA